MKNFHLAILVLIVFTFSSINIWAAGLSPGMDKSDIGKIMRVSEIKRGMRGYGLTVFQGTKIEKFDVEILGIAKKLINGQDLIMVRVGGGPLTTRQTSIIAGMSGSPVYINGKMIGAVAYGTSFCKEPVGLVTPIEYMLGVLDPNLPSVASGYSSKAALSQSVKLDGQNISNIVIGKSESTDKSTMVFRPLAIPLAVSGLSDRWMARLSKLLTPYGIKPMLGSGSGAVISDKPSLVPGAAVGVSIAYGDIDMTGIGTVTYRRGNQILAFGHPMMRLGPLDAPVSTAFITDIISGYEESFKMGAPIDIVAKLTQDRPAAIAATIHQKSHTIPVYVNVKNETDKKSRNYKINIIDHPMLSPSLASTIVGEAIYRMQPVPGHVNARVETIVNADTVGEIKRSNMFFSEDGIDIESVSDLDSILGTLQNNKFHPFDLKSVTVNVVIESGNNTAVIENIRIPNLEYKPGDVVKADLSLRPYKKGIVHKTIDIKIPATLPDGSAVISISGGNNGVSSMSSLMRMLGLVNDSDSASDSPEPENIQQAIEKLLQTPKSNQIVSKLITRAGHIFALGERLPMLPSPIASFMMSPKDSMVRIGKAEIKQVFDSEMLISGSIQIPIRIKSYSASDSRQSAMPTPPMPEGAMGGSGEASPRPPTSSLYADESVNYTKLQDEDLDMLEIADTTEMDQSMDEADVKDDLEIKADAKAVPKQPEATAKATTKAPVKTVVRPLQTWSQKTQSDFMKGKGNGLGASSDNTLGIVPQVIKKIDAGCDIVWSIIPDKTGCTIGTGHKGMVKHIDSDGKVNDIFNTGEMAVYKLAKAADGTIYAGTMPNGRIFKIDTNGKGQLFATLPAKYVTGLIIENDYILASAGDSNKIYKIDANGNLSIYCELPAVQITFLYKDNSNTIYAGCGIKGVVYTIDKSGKYTTFADALEGIPTSMIISPSSQAYIATGPAGAIYKGIAGKDFKAIYSKARNAAALIGNADTDVCLISGEGISVIKDNDFVVKSLEPISQDKEDTQYTTAVKSENGAEIYLGASYPGTVSIVAAASTINKYMSIVHDGLFVCKWSSIQIVTSGMSGSSMFVQTRTGNSEIPDRTWSNWEDVSKEGGKIISPDSRYIQYQISVDGTSTTARSNANIAAATVTYRTPNHKPSVSLTSPTGGEYVAGKKKVTWTGKDPDKDTLMYDVYYSADNGAKWETMVGGVSAKSMVVDEAKITEKINKEVSAVPDVPNEIKQKLLTEDKQPGQPKPPSAPASTNTTHDWDTTKVADGLYVIKVVGSDKTNNGTDALKGDIISEPFIICNAKPKVSIDKETVIVNKDGSVNINGSATTTLTRIVGAAYRVKGGSWMAGNAIDGLFDSNSEDFQISSDPLAADVKQIEVQVVDSAGNETIETVELKK